MQLPLPPFQRIPGSICGLPVVVPILIELGLTLLRLARGCEGIERDREGP